MLKKGKISRYTFKKILKHFSIDIDATRCAILIGVNRKTVNRYYYFFRCAIYERRTQELKSITGEAEVDESYFGGRRVRGRTGKRKRGRGTNKQPVFGIFERDGSVYTEIIPNCKQETLRGIIMGKIRLDSVIYSDGWPGYNGLVDAGYDRHIRINHGNSEFSYGNGIHINGIESFWSFTKRRLAKFNGVKVNFHLHLKESEWRWNRKYEELTVELWNWFKEYSKN